MGRMDEMGQRAWMVSDGMGWEGWIMHGQCFYPATRKRCEMRNGIFKPGNLVL